MGENNKKIAFSGIKPTGELTIGNYLGALKNWTELQDKFDCFFSVVDFHAITTKQDPKLFRKRIYKVLAWYLAFGLDPKKSSIFIQSHISAHTELTWMLNCISHIGELNRMTQFKDKSIKLNQENITVGLFDYPVLMASDILLYNTDIVPIGEDQKQHVELARDLANRFNNNYGKTFKVPEPIIKTSGGRIMGLDNPENKMDKSSESEYNYILLEDSPELIRKKISRATTDSESTIKYDSKRKGLYNLITIYSLFSDIDPMKIEEKYIGKGYAEFKKDLAELIIEKLAPFQEKYNKLVGDEKYLLNIAREGAKKASPIAEKTLHDVKEKMGFI